MSTARNAILLVASILFFAPAVAAPAREPHYPPYRKAADAPRVAKRVSPPPADLRLEAPPSTPSAESTPPVRGARGTQPPAARVRPAPQSAPSHETGFEELDRVAWFEGRWTAHDLFGAAGRREYYRVGLFEGLRAAIADHPDERAWAEGLLAGSLDSIARDDGAAAGEAAAEALARERASAQVAAQFHDLSDWPRFMPDDEPPPPPASDLRLVQPTLDEVFAEFPIPGFGPIRSRTELLLAGWGWDARRLARCSSHVEFLDASWMNAGAGFDHWRQIRFRSEPYERLTEGANGDRFRASFEAAFELALHELYFEIGLPSYDDGFRDGWAYGAFALDELEFRRGWVAGFESGYRASERAAFERVYVEVYGRAYRAAFDDWSSRPKPEIVAVRLLDAGGDEVFEPGEGVFAEYELINYGGEGGDLRVDLDGDVLVLPGRGGVFAPARDRVRSRTTEAGRIEESVPSRTRTELRLSVLDQVRPAPLRVAYPLELDRAAVRTERDDLAGEVQLVVRVRNESTRPIEGSVALSVTAWPGYRDERPIGRLAGRDATDLVFALTGLEPLDLMSGAVALDIDVLGRGVVNDELRRHLPDTVRDLGNRDLFSYLLRLAADAGAAPGTLARARQLVRERLREDWKVAAFGWGNPYRADLEDNGRRTALGDLVLVSMGGSSLERGDEVFEALGREVRELVADLPGAHPLLRRSARRLADRLP